MISKSNIKIGFDTGIKFLKKFSLFESLNYSRDMTFNKSKFSKEFISISKSDSYKEIYDIAIKKKDYDVLLKDNSFFQFSYEEKKGVIHNIRYSYYEIPYKAINYEEYLINQGLNYKDVGDIFREEYEQYVSEVDLKNQTTPIRYDYDIKGYKPIIHSKSHIHIGHNNEIRIPCNKIILPEVFIWFIIRHIYFDNYKEQIEDFSKEYLDCIRKNNKNKDVLVEIEQMDMHLKI